MSQHQPGGFEKARINVENICYGHNGKPMNPNSGWEA